MQARPQGPGATDAGTKAGFAIFLADVLGTDEELGPHLCEECRLGKLPGVTLRWLPRGSRWRRQRWRDLHSIRRNPTRRGAILAGHTEPFAARERMHFADPHARPDLDDPDLLVAFRNASGSLPELDGSIGTETRDDPDVADVPAGRDRRRGHGRRDWRGLLGTSREDPEQAVEEAVAVVIFFVLGLLVLTLLGIRFALALLVASRIGLRHAPFVLGLEARRRG